MSDATPPVFQRLLRGKRIYQMVCPLPGQAKMVHHRDVHARETLYPGRAAANSVIANGHQTRRRAR
jgi:hypothetical protein